MAAQPMIEVTDTQSVSPQPTAADLAVPLSMSLEEYLHTVFRPDREFVNGLVEEKALGGMDHGFLQMEVGHWFRLHRGEWKIRVASELRTQVAPERVRLPDVAVLQEEGLVRERVLSAPPLIAIEILSPEDRLSRLMQRCQDFASMGTAHIWLLDPAERIAFRYSGGALQLVSETRLTVPNSPIYLDLPETFAAALD